MSNLHKKLLHQKINRFEPLQVDVTLDILNILLKERPHSSFVKSLHRQYCERGGLSKKQLEGLYNKASSVKEVPAGKLATLQAIILRKHSKHKSDLPQQTKETGKDNATANMLAEILEKYPQHKTALFLKLKIDKDGLLSTPEIEEVKKFYKLLLRK